MRVPSYPHKPMGAILTVRQHLEAGYQVISHCSAFPAAHQHVVDLEAALASGDVELDYQWKRSQACPECGATGGGISVTGRPA